MAIRPTEEEKMLGREFGWDGHALETGLEKVAEEMYEVKKFL